ncbi:hypothetical protein [Actinoplanes sp. URMC 104]|uniref:hypothetical protein n=1 Tax=Actinoplanes sp. URMC 104 TaxID=3423409 RepID=UPI003F1B1788
MLDVRQRRLEPLPRLGQGESDRLLHTEVLQGELFELLGSQQLVQGDDQRACVDLPRAEPTNTDVVVVHAGHRHGDCGAPPLRLGHRDRIRVVGRRPVVGCARAHGTILAHASTSSIDVALTGLSSARVVAAA